MKMRIKLICVGVLALAGILYTQAIAGTESNFLLYDRAKLFSVAGTTDIDVSASDYTTSVALLTLEPAASSAMYDVKVIFDCDKATTGMDDVGGAATAIFKVSRKVDGTNWRTDISDIANVTTALVMSSMDSASVTLHLGTIDPDSDARVEITLGNETGGDFELPYKLHYRASSSATITEVAN